jgi:hypothetical protein
MPADAPHLPVPWTDLDADRAPAPPQARWLTRAAAVAEALFTVPETAPLEPARLRWLQHQLHLFQQDVGGLGMLIFRTALWAVCALSPWLILRPGSFVRLSLADRVRAMHALEKSPLAMTLFATKALLCMIWFEHPTSARSIGVGGGGPP